MTSADVEAQLAKQLSGIGAPVTLVSAIRSETSQCLREIREDNREHGGTGNEPFFNFVAFDSNPVDPCPFAFTIFRDDTVKFLVGNGLLQPLITMCNQFALSEVDELETQLQTLSPQPLTATFPRSVVEHWLAG